MQFSKNVTLTVGQDIFTDSGFLALLSENMGESFKQKLINKQPLWCYFDLILETSSNTIGLEIRNEYGVPKLKQDFLSGKVFSLSSPRNISQVIVSESCTANITFSIN